MKLSANEAMTLAAKAARGGGAAPAQADAFGRAAVDHLNATGSETDILDALEALPQGPILTLPLVFAAVFEQATAIQASGHIDPAPPLAQSYARTQPYAAALHQKDTALDVTFDLTCPAPRMQVHRVAMTQDLYARMQQLAANLLVPDTATSRSAGAGAGLTDND